MKRKETNFIFVLTATYIILLSVLVGLKYMSDAIPREWIRNNAQNSLKMLSEEGDYKKFIGDIYYYQTDNFTDAIIVGECLAEKPDLPFIARYLYSPVFPGVEGLSKVESVYSQSLNSNFDQFNSYARYWHGYDVVVRPLLLFLDYRGIRILNFMLMILLAIWVGLRLQQRCGYRYMWFLFISLVAVGFPLLSLTIQFASCFYIALIASLIVLYLPSVWLSTGRVAILCFIIGGATAFFDFLTAPLVTLGLPLTIILLLRNRFPDWRCLFICGAMWSLGYVGIWSGKWILTWILLDRGILDNVVAQFGVRTHWFDLTGIAHVRRNIAGLVVIGIGILIIFWLGVKRGIGRKGIRYSSLIFLSSTPYLWIFIAQNHSFVHGFFVWRIFSVTIFSLLSYISIVFGSRRIYRRK